MLSPTVPNYRKRRGRPKKSAQTPAPPVALTLVAAVYIFEYLFVELEFDRDIDIAGVDASELQVFDGYFTETNYYGSGATLVSPVRVRFSLILAGEWVDPDVKLTA